MRTESATVAETIRLDVDAAAVVVIDAQNDFCHVDGLQAQLGKDVGRLEAPLGRLADFVGQARRAGVPVVFVQNVHTVDDASLAWRHRHPDPHRPQVCLDGSWGAEFRVVAPALGDQVVRKHRYSAFAGTTMRQTLEALGRTSLLFTGFTTSVCVESSLREAVCRDYLATLVEDCCGDYKQQAHDRAVAAISSGFGLVTTSEDVVASWTSEPRPSPHALPPRPVLEA